MQTQLAPAILATSSGRRADEILRACVHCGFCNATCPTYLLTGDELDGPRGRIYLIKDMLETDAPTPIAREHLDRCLTCRACETTCPSGVAYGELAEIGRNFIEAREPRGFSERFVRGWLVRILPVPTRLALFVAPRPSRQVGDAGLSGARGAAHPRAERGRGEESSAPRRGAGGLRAALDHAGSERGAGARARRRGRENGSCGRRGDAAARSSCTWARNSARTRRCAPTSMRCSKQLQTPRRSSRPRVVVA